jgi:hypothetical protein
MIVGKFKSHPKKSGNGNMLIYLNKQTWLTHAQAGKKGSYVRVLIDLPFLTKAANYLCVDLVLPRLISRGIR